MALPAEKPRYTFADALTWDEGERAELIDGEVILMAPAPSRVHQGISGEIFRQLGNYLKGKKCKVYAAPFDVRLFEVDGDRPEDVDTVVEPDITVVCDPSKLDERGCKGAPDMVVEILSPSTRKKDLTVKLRKYIGAGVSEYWIVDPDKKKVVVYDFAHEELPAVYGFDSKIPAGIFKGECEVDFAEIYEYISFLY